MILFYYTPHHIPNQPQNVYHIDDIMKIQSQDYKYYRLNIFILYINFT